MPPSRFRIRSGSDAPVYNCRVSQTHDRPRARVIWINALEEEEPRRPGSPARRGSCSTTICSSDHGWRALGAERQDSNNSAQLNVFAAVGVISAGPWGRRLGCRAAGSPACCRYPAQVRACPDRRPRAGTARRPTGPVCRPAARSAGRLWFARARPCLSTGPVASVRNWRRARVTAGPFEPGVSPALAEPGLPPRRRPPSVHMKEGATV